MGDNDLRILYEAEKKAKKKVADARNWADATIRKAEVAISDEREKRIMEFRSTRDVRIKETEKAAVIAAGRIKDQGVALAGDLKEEARQRVPASVEKVLEHFREE